MTFLLFAPSLVGSEGSGDREATEVSPGRTDGRARDAVGAAHDDVDGVGRGGDRHAGLRIFLVDPVGPPVVVSALGDRPLPTTTCKKV